MFRGLRAGRRASAPPDDLEQLTPAGPADWRRLLGYLKPYRGRMAIAFVALIGSSLLSLVFPAVISSWSMRCCCRAAWSCSTV
jgi:hypothetical protein